MARQKSKASNRRYHMSGQSVVTIAGRDIYLRPHEAFNAEPPAPSFMMSMLLVDRPVNLIVRLSGMPMQKLLLALALTVALFSIGCETQTTSKPPLPAPRSNEVEAANARLFDLLWGNTETENWTNESLREELPQWQADFLLASMHVGMCENLGYFQGLVLSTRGNELPELVATWQRIGAWKTANALERTGQLAKKRGWHPEQEDLDNLSRDVQAEIEAYLENQPLEPVGEVTVLLFSYYNENFYHEQLKQSGTQSH